MILDIVSAPTAKSGPGEDHEAIVVEPDLSAVTAKDPVVRVVENHDEGGVAWSVDRAEECIEIGPIPPHPASAAAPCAVAVVPSVAS